MALFSGWLLCRGCVRDEGVCLHHQPLPPLWRVLEYWLDGAGDVLVAFRASNLNVEVERGCLILAGCVAVERDLNLDSS